MLGGLLALGVLSPAGLERRVLLLDGVGGVLEDEETEHHHRTTRGV